MSESTIILGTEWRVRLFGVIRGSRLKVLKHRDKMSNKDIVIKMSLINYMKI